MEEYIVEFYCKENGEEPARIFIENLEAKMIAKILRVIEMLEKNGPFVRMPYSEYLKNGIFEIRTKQGTNIARVLYFFRLGRK